MSTEHLTNNGMYAFGKEMLLIESEVGRLMKGGISEDDDVELRSRHAGLLLDHSGEAGSWYGWGDGEGMYLEGDRGDWTGWGGGRPQLGEGASQDQTWEMNGSEEGGYIWGGRDEGEGRHGGEEVEKSQAELEELDTLRRGGRRRRRRRKRPWSGALKENAPPEAGGLKRKACKWFLADGQFNLQLS